MSTPLTTVCMSEDVIKTAIVQWLNSYHDSGRWYSDTDIAFTVNATALAGEPAECIDVTISATATKGGGE